jgi:hypothetical protein
LTDWNSQDVQVSFRLNRQPQEAPIPALDFEEGYRSTQFDGALSLVSLGDFRIREHMREAKQTSSVVGRSDALFIFDWLRRKGVVRIIRVEVKDLTTPIHSEDSIERALKGFHVEFLDWRRADICPVIIRNVGDAVEELALYWGGNNVVLRGWSEPEGLPRLSKLKKILLEILGVSVIAYGHWCRHPEPTLTRSNRTHPMMSDCDVT